MKIHDLAPKNAKPARKRKGQGNGSGNGTFAGRGCNGQNARAGGGVRLGFEGGQTPLIQRMPKRRGFNNPNRIETQAIDVAALDAVFKSGDTVNLEALVVSGLVTSAKKQVKILASGEISKDLRLEGLAVSAGAKAAIEKAGGSVA